MTNKGEGEQGIDLINTLRGGPIAWLKAIGRWMKFNKPNTDPVSPPIDESSNMGWLFDPAIPDPNAPLTAAQAEEDLREKNKVWYGPMTEAERKRLKL